MITMKVNLSEFFFLAGYRECVILKLITKKLEEIGSSFREEISIISKLFPRYNQNVG
jgi:hypothetical protein